MTTIKYLLAAFLLLGAVSCGHQSETRVESVAPITTTTIEPTTTSTIPEETTTTTVPWPALAPQLPPVAPTTTSAPTTTAKPFAPYNANQSVPVNGYLQCVKMRESRGNPKALNSSSGASGYYQFLDSTWAAMGFAKKYGVNKAMYASPAQQDAAALEAYARYGKQPWGNC